MPIIHNNMCAMPCVQIAATHGISAAHSKRTGGSTRPARTLCSSHCGETTHAPRARAKRSLRVRRPGRCSVSLREPRRISRCRRDGSAGQVARELRGPCQWCTRRSPRRESIEGGYAVHLQAYALARATSVRPDILAPAEGRVAVLCGKPFRPRYFARKTFFPDRPFL